MDAVVIMPEHLHCIWSLHEGERLSGNTGWKHFIRDETDYFRQVDIFKIIRLNMAMWMR